MTESKLGFLMRLGKNKLGFMGIRKEDKVSSLTSWTIRDQERVERDREEIRDRRGDLVATTKRDPTATSQRRSKRRSNDDFAEEIGDGSDFAVEIEEEIYR